MAKSNTELGRKLATQGAKLTPSVIKQELKGWMEKNQSGLLNYFAQDKNKLAQMMMAAMQAISMNPKLLECTKESLTACILRSCEMNL